MRVGQNSPSKQNTFSKSIEKEKGVKYGQS